LHNVTVRGFGNIKMLTNVWRKNYVYMLRLLRLLTKILTYC